MTLPSSRVVSGSRAGVGAEGFEACVAWRRYSAYAGAISQRCGVTAMSVSYSVSVVIVQLYLR